MLASTLCLDCGTELSLERWSGGLCPRCLLELALESPSFDPEASEDPDVQPTLAYSSEALAPGRILGRRYQIRSLLGRGGMGEVWRAFDLKLRVDVALKALRRELLENARALELLRSEVRSAREVMSPNVCRLFDLVELDGQELVSMEYIDGKTLLETLHSRGPLELEEAREIASQFLAGLEAIHAADLVHRDLKPENLMITRSGRVVVMDFGIAKGLAEGQVGTVSGTPAYMAPEHARGEAVDARADVFSAGVVLAEMIAPGGVQSPTAREAVWRGVHSDPPDLPDTPWTSVLKKAVAHQRDSRFDSASSLARALEEVTFRVEGAEDLRPYPGLASFTQEDAEYFFGRELEVEAMWRKLRRPHLLGLIGPSGAGKSSFLRAGLLPVMPEGWRAVISTPGSRPFIGLARVLADELAGDREAVHQLLQFEEPEAAVSLVSRWRQQHEQALIIVDQFEELFTLNPPEVQGRFAELLGRLALEADVHVLLSMRDDFLYHCHGYAPLAPILDGLTLMSPPAGAALRRAVVQPALKCGYRFEDEALVEEILSEVREERGALPMLAFAAAQLWEKRDRESGLLTRDAYAEIGGVGGALAQHAEAALEQIGNDRIPIVREIFRNLVTAQGTRAARDRDELLSVFESSETAGREAADVLNTLIDARLLTSYEVPPTEDEDTGHHRIEIIHESLLTAWPRLVRWQSQDTDSALLRDELRQAAQTWGQHNRSEDLLWTGTAFKEFQLWRERYPGGLSDIEEAFTQAMTTHALRRKRRRRIAVTAVVIGSLTVAAVTGAFWHRSVISEEQAKAEARRAEASKLLALGQLEIDENPTAAVAYAIKSLELSDTYEARVFALKALWRGPTALILSPVQPEKGSEYEVLRDVFYHRIAFSPDGKWLAAAGFPGNGQLWSEDGQTHQWFGGHEGEPSSMPGVRFGYQSKLLLSGALGTIRFWSVPDARPLDTLEFEERTWFQPVGAQLFTFTQVDEDRYRIQSRLLEGGEPKLLGQLEGAGWEPDPKGQWLAFFKERAVYAVPVKELSTAQPRLVGSHDAPIRRIVFTPDGDRIASLSEDGEIRIWAFPPVSTEPQRVLEKTEGAYWMAFDPSGSLLAAQSGYYSAHLWDLSGPPDAEPSVVRRTGIARTSELAFHPSGRWLATAHQETMAFWPLSRRYSYVIRSRTEGESPMVAFTPDGRWLASAAVGLRLWPLSADAGGESRVLLEGELGGYWPDMKVDSVGQRLLVAGSSGRLWIVPLDGGEPQALKTGFSSNLMAVAADPQGRRAAVATFDSPAAEKVIRVVNLESGAVQVVGPTPGARDGGLGATYDLEFTPNGRLLSSGDYGLVRWNLEDGSHEVLSARESAPHRWMGSSPDGQILAVGQWREGEAFSTIYDLDNGSSRDVASHGQSVSFTTLDPTGRFLVTGDQWGVIRVGSVSGDEPHLLLGHEGLIGTIAVSPDGRWLASTEMDGTIRLWPMPDLTKPPFHTLPYDELLTKLRSLTNLRAVEDPESSTGYKLEPGPFPGWETVPTW